MAFATCRGCGRAFAKDGYAAQSQNAPRLCRDCFYRERAYHPKHAPRTTCIAEHMR